MTTIQFEIKDCRECPFNEKSHTPGSGYGVDFICSKTGKGTFFYVEWERDIKPVPDWCPIRVEVQP